jgi:Icc protein
MIIAQISDTHIALDSPDADQRIRDFELTIGDINVLDPAPDVIVHTGDIVHNGRQDEYRQAVATLAKARAPVYVLAGNKDSRVNLREALCRNLALHAEFVEYAIDDYPVRLIALDTLSSRSNKGDFCPERVKHLIKMLDSEITKPIAVFTHHPPFEVTVGPDPLHFETPEVMSTLCRALQRSGRVVGIFSALEDDICHLTTPSSPAHSRLDQLRTLVCTALIPTLPSAGCSADMRCLCSGRSDKAVGNQ